MRWNESYWLRAWKGSCFSREGTRKFACSLCRLVNVRASMDGIDMETAVEPIALFEAWMKAAEASELNDASAVALATATRDGMPSVRMVLMKRVDQRGFCFYTNAESQKGVELAENPRAAMCFHWKTLRRQVRISGGVSELSAEEADDYFESRPRLSQLAAVASEQSRNLANREVLEARVKELERAFPEKIPRPTYWIGYLLRPERIEFWKNGAGRMHDRFLFLRSGEGWRKERLYP
jgi:pyridoxamine 5'-phosphate oxidase